MLVLARKMDEKITLTHGDTVIMLTVVSASGGKVRLGIDAPPEVQIARSELIDEEEMLRRDAARQRI